MPFYLAQTVRITVFGQFFGRFFLFVANFFCCPKHFCEFLSIYLPPVKFRSIFATSKNKNQQ